MRKKESYVTQLTITVCAVDREMCERASDVIAYSANCVENELENTAIVVVEESSILNKKETLRKL